MEIYKLDSNASSCSVSSLLSQNGLSNTTKKRIKQYGSIVVNNNLVTIKYMLRPGEQVEINLPNIPSSIIPQTNDLKIYYEDEDLIVLDKPAGLLIHPTTTNALNTLSNYLAGYYRENNIVAGIHPVSRLDKNTSGLVIFAKKPHIQHKLTQTKLEKEYLALFTGIPAVREGLISAPIGRKPNSIIERMIDLQNGKEALTAYKVLALYKDCSLVKLKLLTGRTHQIRVHAAYLGHPLLNDNLYGTKGPQTRHALHSWRLSFFHPINNKFLVFTSQLPSDLITIIKKHRY